MANQALSWRPLARVAAMAPALALSLLSAACSSDESGALGQADAPSKPPPVSNEAGESEAPGRADEASKLADDRPGPAVTYEAVFLRNEPTADDAGDVLVIAVSPDGTEREAKRLTGRAAVDPNGRFNAPQGAVSPGGLLAILQIDYEFDYWARPRMRIDRFRTVIVDLTVAATGLRWNGEYRFGSSEPPPRLRAAWGPDDQVALLEDYAGRQLRVVRVTASGPVDQHVLGDDQAERDSFMEADSFMESYGPVWASDGSGLIIGLGPNYEARLGVLLLDSTIRHDMPGAFVDGVGGRPVSADAATLDILSDFGPPPMVRASYPDGEEMLGTLPGIGEGSLLPSDLAWTADGAGVWVIAEEPTGDGRVVRIGLFDPPTLEMLPFQLDAAAEPEPDDGTPAATFAGLAPDDSLLVLTLAGRELTTLVEPDSGTTFDVEGTFVGWLIKD